MSIATKSPKTWNVLPKRQYNQPTISPHSNLMIPLPLKIYRKEIASAPTTTPTIPRTGGQSIDYPGESCRTTNLVPWNASNIYDGAGALAKAPNLYPEMRSIDGYTNIVRQEKYKDVFPESAFCENQMSVRCVQNNHLRLVKGVPVITEKERINESKQGKGVPCSSYGQYHNRRNISYERNHLNCRITDEPNNPIGRMLYNESFLLPTYQSTHSSFSVYFPHRTFFQYQWITPPSESSPSLYDVVFLEGKYTIYDLNSILENTMIVNGHYYINKNTNAKVIFISIVYNPTTERIELRSYLSCTALFDNTTFQPALWYDTIPNIQTDDVLCCKVIFPDSDLADSLGFSSREEYPTDSIQTEFFQTTHSQYIRFIASRKPTVYWQPPNTTKFVYKPNNPQFSTQGPVRSSTLISRKRYNAATWNGNLYKTRDANTLDSLVIYGQSQSAMNWKTKLFPAIPCENMTPSHR